MKSARTTERRLRGWFVLSTGAVCFLLFHQITPPAADGSVYESEKEVHDGIDVVGFAVKPTCVSKKAVSALNEYFAPRRIIVVTTSESACSSFRTFAENVECLVENDLLPGVSRNSIDRFMSRTYENYTAGMYKGRDVAAWYLQQFLKMGAAYYINDLSDYHLIWDLDMILLSDLAIFHKDHPEAKAKTIINIGGHNNPGYDWSYEKLTGTPLQRASDGSSFVTHWMAVYKPYMIEFTSFLETKTRPVHAPIDSPWVWSVLNALPRDWLHMGFSEYASYNSWISYNYPESIHEMSKKTWSRYPIGGGYVGMLLLAYGSEDKLCCPDDITIKAMQKLKYQYFGVEIGHNPVCQYNHPKFKDGYGI